DYYCCSYAGNYIDVF
nr:immunoglobulin light chain junction region [Macaca mulatta]MOW58465.1 immunoglobulin light chain junction region [Macaca mulatta]MOW58709.1 immunoglobulin light chain junction region [Macaca mulatta]MOW58811.1 immunoglobulin light chain junction region [Macaca mulatta]MOW59748.1 immunoglobulin light chain junction region [Macaca mulatta]